MEYFILLIILFLVIMLFVRVLLPLVIFLLPVIIVLYIYYRYRYAKYLKESQEEFETKKAQYYNQSYQNDDIIDVNYKVVDEENHETWD